jgi:hypothetical protein
MPPQLFRRAPSVPPLSSEMQRLADEQAQQEQARMRRARTADRPGLGFMRLTVHFGRWALGGEMPKVSPSLCGQKIGESI